MAKLLLEKDVSPDYEDYCGCMPLPYAAEHGFEAVVKLPEKGVELSNNMT
jgi:hypothetical protein